MLREIAVLGPLSSHGETTAFLGCEVWDGIPRPHRPVVVVWLPESLTADPQALARLESETRQVTVLDHPGVARVHGLFAFEEGWARVVEFVDGEPLSVVEPRLRSHLGGVVPSGWVVRVGLDVVEALSHAHEVGRSRDGRPWVHGGVRPDTLQVGFDGRVRVTGFGAGPFAAHRSESGAFDPRSYMAPEQILRGPDRATVATDVYMVCAVLYRLAAGAPPHIGSGDLEQAILTGDVPRLPAETAELQDVLRKGLSREAQDRHEDLDALQQALRGAVGPEQVPDREEVARVLGILIPSDSSARQGRRALLESAADPDTATILSVRQDHRPVAAPGFGPSSAWTVPGAGGGERGPLAEGSPGGSSGLGSLEGAPGAASVSSGVGSGSTTAGGAPPPGEALDRSRPGAVATERPTAPETAPVAEAVAGAEVGDGSGPRDVAPDEPVPGIDADEEVSHFEDDGSRSVGWLVGLAVVAGVALAFWAMPPSQTAEIDPEGGAPPRELVEAALRRERPDGVVGPKSVPSDAVWRQVVLEVEPPVDVYWGDRRLGRTPTRVRLPAVRVELRLTDRSRRINAYRVIEPSATALDVVLEPAELSLDAPAGADVFLNGRRLGKAPVGTVTLYEGDYLIDVRHRGRRFKRLLRAEPGSRLAVTADP